MAALAYRTEEVSRTPRGYRVRSVKKAGHVVRIAFPPGPRRKGSGQVVQILHPKKETNPKCEVAENAKKNPGELLIFGNPAANRGKGNPARKRNAGHKPGCPCFACKHQRSKKSKVESRKQNSTLGRKRAARERASRIRSARPACRTGRLNPSPIQAAVRLFEKFHGRDPKEIVEKHVSAAMRKDYTALGDLDYLKVRTPVGDLVQFTFEGDRVILASSPDGRQLYAIGGNQNVESCIDDDSLKKDFIDLGDGVEVAYTARKIHSGYQPVQWFHKFGEKTGSLPSISYDKLRKHIFFMGGDYFIDTKPSVSPGIEN